MKIQKMLLGLLFVAAPAVCDSDLPAAPTTEDLSKQSAEYLAAKEQWLKKYREAAHHQCIKDGLASTTFSDEECDNIASLFVESISAYDHTKEPFDILMANRFGDGHYSNKLSNYGNKAFELNVLAAANQNNPEFVAFVDEIVSLFEVVIESRSVEEANKFNDTRRYLIPRIEKAVKNGMSLTDFQKKIEKKLSLLDILSQDKKDILNLAKNMYAQKKICSAIELYQKKIGAKKAAEQRQEVEVEEVVEESQNE